MTAQISDSGALGAPLSLIWAINYHSLSFFPQICRTFVANYEFINNNNYTP